MYRQNFEYKVFDNPDELTTHCNKEGITVVSVMNNKEDKYVVFYYKRIMFYESEKVPKGSYGFKDWDIWD